MSPETLEEEKCTEETFPRLLQPQRLFLDDSILDEIQPPTAIMTPYPVQPG